MTPAELAAKIENAKPAAADLFRLAMDHRKIYLTLEKAAAAELRPIVDHYINTGDFEKAESFVNENYPDTVAKMLILKVIFDAADALEPKP